MTSMAYFDTEEASFAGNNTPPKEPLLNVNLKDLPSLATNSCDASSQFDNTISVRRVKELEKEPFLIREEGSGTRGAMERFFKQQKLKLMST